MTTGPSDSAQVDADVESFLNRVAGALLHQAQGRPEPFLSLWSHTDNVALMAAVGGYQRGYEQVSKTLIEAAQSQNFRAREAQRLLIEFTADVGVTVEVETLKREIDDQPSDMTLRATMIYRRENGQWKVIHRHGDLLGPVGVKW